MKEFERQLNIVIVVMFLLIAAGFLGYHAGVSEKESRIVERDTSTYIDTIPYYQPVPKDSMVIKYVTRTLPVKRRDSSTTNKTDTFLAENYAQNNGENIPPLYASVDSDSAAVVVPITQKRYENADYRAYVSGYEANLDSIFVFPKHTIIRERSEKPPNKWHIGITGGYGYGIKSKQLEPYIGVGLTYSLFSF